MMRFLERECDHALPIWRDHAQGPGVRARLSGTRESLSLGDAVGRVAFRHLASQRGPRALLLHGNPADMDSWSELTHELAEHMEMLALDLPGFGESDEAVPRPGASALDSAADWAHAAALRLGWDEPYFVVGHSHGAAVAQALAVRHPRSVAGLVLIASLGVPAHVAYRQLALPGMPALLRVPATLVRLEAIRPLMRRVLRAIMRPMFYPALLEEAQVAAQLAAFTRRPRLFIQMALVARGNPSKQLARDAKHIGAPVLFIHGAQDRLVPIANAHGVAAMLSKAASVAFETVAEAGHMLHLTHAPIVGGLITAWLGEVSPHPQGEH